MSDPVTPLPVPEAQPSLDAYWMPFTHNRYFKQHPRLLAEAKGMHYTAAGGSRILDGLAGLWCCNAGHCHPRVVEAIREQAATLDYSCAFQLGHPGAFALAGRLAELAPDGLDRVFFTNSGSEAVDTALKIAIAHHHARGQAGRTRLIGRERAYHGVGFGGISVGGMTPNRKMFGPLLPGVDHLPHTYEPAKMAFSRGQPEWGAHLADELERIIALHDASTVAAVIVEPFQGSAGVIVPPVGYLQRLRAICDRHGVLLIFDEVISGFGRVGAPFASQRFGVVPDMITFAKGVTSGAVPLGGVLVSEDIYQSFMTGPEHMVELFHGYTYSGHPLAMAAGLACLDVYREEGLFERAAALEPVLEDAMHSLRGEPHVKDVRNIGLAAAVELEPIEGQPSLRAMRGFHWCFDHGVLIRFTGDILATAPALIAGREDVEKIVDTIRQALRVID